MSASLRAISIAPCASAHWRGPKYTFNSCNAKKVTVSVLYWQPNITTRSCAVGDICAACRKIYLPHLLLLLGLGPRPPSSSSRPCALQWRAVPPGGSCLGGRDFGRPPSSGSSPAPVSRPVWSSAVAEPLHSSLRANTALSHARLSISQPCASASALASASAARFLASSQHEEDDQVLNA
jgi:hypothetical protein